MVSASGVEIDFWKSHFTSYILFGEHYCYIMFYLIFLNYVFYVRAMYGNLRELNIQIMSALDNKTEEKSGKIQEPSLNAIKCFEVVLIEDSPLREAGQETYLLARIICINV
jgi:hypothetical protein